MPRVRSTDRLRGGQMSITDELGNRAGNLNGTDVRGHAENFLFGKPLVVNVYRSVIVEAMIDLALGDCWEWVAGDYGPFDFQHRDGTRLEVKQASYQQTWELTVEPAPRFDVAKRTGFYQQNKWHKHDLPDRNTDLYVFGYHGVEERSLADHRRADQWMFAIVDAASLDDEQSLSHGRISAMSEWYPIGELRGNVDRHRLNRPCS
jgi:hypothetical protein